MRVSCSAACLGWSWCCIRPRNLLHPWCSSVGADLQGSWMQCAGSWWPWFRRLVLPGQVLPAQRRPLKTRTSCLGGKYVSGPRTLLWREEVYCFCLLIIPQLPKHWIMFVILSSSISLSLLFWPRSSLLAPSSLAPCSIQGLITALHFVFPSLKLLLFVLSSSGNANNPLPLKVFIFCDLVSPEPSLWQTVEIEFLLCNLTH